MDALSNYEEQDKQAAESSEKYKVSAGNPVTPYWDTWVGNDAWTRVGVSITATLVAALGVVGPVVFGGMSAVFALGTMILMAFFPVLLLAGVLGDRGFSMFRDYGTLIVKTMVLRVVTGITLVLSVVFSLTAIGLMDSIGWAQGMILIIASTWLLIKSRDRMVAAIMMSGLGGRMGRLGQGLASLGGKTWHTMRSSAKVPGRIAVAAAGGAHGARSTGMSMRRGALNGIKGELGFAVGNSKPAAALKQHMGQQCAMCGRPLDSNTGQNTKAHRVRGGVLKNGLMLCADCAASQDAPSSKPVNTIHGGGGSGRRASRGRGGNGTWTRKELRKADSDSIYQAYNKPKTEYTNNLTHKNMAWLENHHPVMNGHETERTSAQQERVKNKGLNMMVPLMMDIRRHESGEIQGSPEIPHFLQPYFSGQDRQCLDMAWKKSDYTYIQAFYVAALRAWFNNAVDTNVKLEYEDLLKELENPNSHLWKEADRRLNLRKNAHKGGSTSST